MERFIVTKLVESICMADNLKSSMERFIVFRESVRN